MSTDVTDSTLEDLPHQPSGRGLMATRIGQALIALLVVLGAVGVFGPKDGDASASGGGYDLAVSYPAVTRAGQPTPLHLTITHAGGFTGPVQVSICDGFFDDIDFQNWFPAPSAETGHPPRVVYEFDKPPGDTLEVSLDARTAPGQFGAVDDCEVAVLVDDAPATSLTFTSWRMP